MYRCIAILIKAAYKLLDEAQAMAAKMIPDDMGIIIKIKAAKDVLWQLLREINPGEDV